jgi:DNA-directed RNA polymerase subunit beta
MVQTLAETLADPDTGEVIAQKDTVIDKNVMETIPILGT